jgi:hypothetical protein
MAAFQHAGFAPEGWIQTLEDYDSGSMLDEFILGVRSGDANAQLMSARSTTGRAAWHKNAVASWLKHTGYTDHSVIAGVVAAFETQKKRPDKWVAELERMQKQGELQVFLDAVSNPVWAHEQMLASASRRSRANVKSADAGGGGGNGGGGEQQQEESGASLRIGKDRLSPRKAVLEQRAQAAGWGSARGKDGGSGGDAAAGVVQEQHTLPSSFKSAGKMVLAAQRMKGGPPAMSQRGTAPPPPVPKASKGGKKVPAAVAAALKSGGGAEGTAPQEGGDEDTAGDSMLEELGGIDGLSSDGEGDSMMDEMAALDGLMDSSDDDEEEEEQLGQGAGEGVEEDEAGSEDDLDMLDGLDDLLDSD